MKKLTSILFIMCTYITTLYPANLPPNTLTRTTLHTPQLQPPMHTQNRNNQLNQDAPSPFDILPDELLQHTLGFLDSGPVALVHASRVCHRWHNATTDITHTTINNLLSTSHQDSNAALIKSIMLNYADLIKPIINKGALINKIYKIHFTEKNNEIKIETHTPLTLAVQLKTKHDDVDFCPIIQALLACKADPNLKLTPYSANALEYAAILNNENIVGILLKHGAQISEVNSNYFDDSSQTIQSMIDLNTPWLHRRSTISKCETCLITTQTLFALIILINCVFCAHTEGNLVCEDTLF